MKFWILKKNNMMCQIFDKVRKISKFGWFDMPMGSTFEIGTQIILLKIDGFLKGWILNINPLKHYHLQVQANPKKIVQKDWYYF